MDNTPVYSRLDRLPNKRASENITEGCVALEGGAFRGLYSSGVLDALMESDINLRCTAGVSAGAMNGIAYACGHIGYSARVNLGHRHDKKYVGLGAWKNNKGIIGFEVAFGAPDGLEPLDLGIIPRLGKRFVAVATNLLTGKEEYFDADGTDSIFNAIRASASMPYVSKPVFINGKPYLDGGCACKVPYRWAMEQGCEKIIVVRTRPDDYRKEVKHGSHGATRLLYRKYPEFVSSLVNSDRDYNRSCDEIETLRRSGRIFVISPSGAVNVGRLEKDMEKLGALYHMGYDDTMRLLPQIKSYLGITV